MVMQRWTPATTVSRGNVALGIAPSVANLNSPTVAELNESIAIECSVTDFNASSSTDSEAVDWLCTTESEQLPTTTTFTIDDLLVKATGQNDQQFLQGLRVGDVVYLYRRDGVDSERDITAGDSVWVWRVIITSIDPAEASNAFIGLNLHINVLDRSTVAATVISSGPITPPVEPEPEQPDPEPEVPPRTNQATSILSTPDMMYALTAGQLALLMDIQAKATASGEDVLKYISHAMDMPDIKAFLTYDELNELSLLSLPDNRFSLIAADYRAGSVESEYTAGVAALNVFDADVASGKVVL